MVASPNPIAATSSLDPVISGLGILSNLTGAGAPAGPALSGGNPLFNDRNYINVAPVGVNLGEILRNWEGDPANGGFGYAGTSRLLGGQSGVSGGVSVQGGIGAAPIILIAGAGLALLYLLRRK